MKVLPKEGEQHDNTHGHCSAASPRQPRFSAWGAPRGSQQKGGQSSLREWPLLLREKPDLRWGLTEGGRWAPEKCWEPFERESKGAVMTFQDGEVPRASSAGRPGLAEMEKNRAWCSDHSQAGQVWVTVLHT